MLHNDDQLHKCLETLASGYLFTFQEKPEGQGKPLRDDIFKKIVTGEGMFGRMPFAVLTKLFRLIGWKRFEVNKMCKFLGVTQTSLQSLLRRCIVIEIKARFLDANHRSAYPRWLDEVGIFGRDPHAADLLCSGPGVLYGLRRLLIFERKFDEAQMRNFPDHYVNGGGDGGTTYRHILEACPNCPAPRRATLRVIGRPPLHELGVAPPAEQLVEGFEDPLAHELAAEAHGHVPHCQGEVPGHGVCLQAEVPAAWPFGNLVQV